MTSPSGMSRRRFMATTGAALAFPTIVRARSLGLGSAPAPSNRVTLGLIGCGGMGRSDLSSLMPKAGVIALAVADPDRSHREAARAEVLQRRRAAGDSSPACDAYNDYRDLLARPDIDAVIVGSPDHWHSLHVVHAAKAGKDIYGEKPLSLTIHEGRVMSDTIRQYGRVFQTGSQQRSDRLFRHACELVRNGRIGRVRRVTCGLPAGERTGNHPPFPVPDGFDYDMWLGPAPWEPYCEHRTHYEFRHLLDYSGGKLTDWGAHHIDIGQWALGEMESGPTRISATGTYPQDGLWNAPVDYTVTATYASGVELIATSSAENGVLFVGDDGWVFVTRGRIDAQPKALLSEVFLPREDRLEISNDHHQNFLDCVRSRRDPIAPIEHAHRSISIAHLGNIALKLGRAITWDPPTETIAGDPTASAMLSRPMRGPWRL
ncbi:MAG: Gfo/Idh/MocA family oxidoreductase [Phycisphaeraceae bacterium]|nr:Gfo/Idh/MocA family oxidoreductase [Phycisphaeraceae bacterium]